MLDRALFTGVLAGVVVALLATLEGVGQSMTLELALTMALVAGFADALRRAAIAATERAEPPLLRRP